jgi:hypothetical protein
MALLGNVLDTVDGLLGTATGALNSGAGAIGGVTAGATGAADLSHTLDVGAVIQTAPSVDLSTPDLLGLGGIDASVSAPTMIGVSADSNLDAGGLLNGLV